MGNIELSISKLITGIGLFFDLIGVLLLLYIEQKNRRKDILSQDCLEKQSFIDYYIAAKQGKTLDETEEESEIKKINKTLSLNKAQKISKIALCLLTLGFLLQIISLFITI